MKKFLTMSSLLFLLLPAIGQDAAAKIDSLVSAYSKLHKFNGSILVAKQGHLLINKGFGYKNVAAKKLNDENSVFQLGSITKQFTGAVILKLQEEKKLDVNDKIIKYFPGFPKGDSITIKHLLTHTSGIYNYTNDREFMENEVTHPKSKEQMIALFKDKPLDFSPGTQWSYSNSGYSLLGYIIEAVAKTSYENAVRRYIFKSAQMTHSGFDFTNLKNDNKTTGYFVVDGKEAPETPIVDSTVSYSAGSIYSTTGDLYNWHKSLQKNIVLTKAQQETAYTAVKNNYGYGWMMDSIDGKRRLFHGGGIPGYITNFSRVPQDDICIVLLSNASDKTLSTITSSIYAILYNKPYELPAEKKAIALPAATLEQYIGEYEMRPGFIITLSVKENGLNAGVTGQGDKFILPEKEDLFFDTGNDVQLQFTRDNDKKVDGFILMQGGRKTNCKKIK